MRDAIQIVNKFLLTGTVHLIDLIHTPITRPSSSSCPKWIHGPCCPGFLDMFYLDNDLTELRDGIAESMSRGLHTKDASTIKMLPSFVENLPSKDGNSTYVALDLGGTNFRVLLINIVDDNIDMDSQIYSVPQRNRSRNL